MKDAYATLYSLYEEQGLSPDEINELAVLDVKEQDYFSQRGYADQHAGGLAFAFDEKIIPRKSRQKKSTYLSIDALQKIIIIVFAGDQPSSSQSTRFRDLIPS